MEDKARLHIALITYEYPEELFIGGVAIYMRALANLMSSINHTVEIFCASESRSQAYRQGNVWVCPVLCENVEAFRENVVEVFTKRHKLNAFDIIEAPDSLYPSLNIRTEFPDIPHILKLHASHYVLHPYKTTMTWLQKFRVIFGAWRRGRKYDAYWKYKFQNDPEYHLASSCLFMYCPSAFMLEKVKKTWPLTDHTLSVIPNPFEPDSSLLELPLPDVERVGKKILYLGRIDELKGVLELLKVIPDLCKKYPEMQWLIVGNSSVSGSIGDHKKYLMKRLKEFRDQIEFRNQVSHDDLPALFRESDICVFPSRFESFGYACLEAMSAGKPIVANINSGMKDLLSDSCGLVVDTYDTQSFFQAVDLLVKDGSLRKRLAENARKKARTNYCSVPLARSIETFYEKAIEHRFAKNCINL